MISIRWSPLLDGQPTTTHLWGNVESIGLNREWVETEKLFLVLLCPNRQSFILKVSCVITETDRSEAIQAFLPEWIEQFADIRDAESIRLNIVDYSAFEKSVINDGGKVSAAPVAYLVLFDANASTDADRSGSADFAIVRPLGEDFPWVRTMPYDDNRRFPLPRPDIGSRWTDLDRRHPLIRGCIHPIVVDGTIYAVQVSNFSADDSASGFRCAAAIRFLSIAPKSLGQIENSLVQLKAQLSAKHPASSNALKILDSIIDCCFRATENTLTAFRPPRHFLVDGHLGIGGEKMIRDICEMLGINCFTISAINILINDGGSEEKGGAASSLDFETMQALAKAFYSPPAVVILLDVEMALGYNEVVPREQFVGRLKLLKHLSELRPAICLAGLIDFIGGGRGDRLSSVPTFLLELFDYSLVKLTIPLREERQEILKQQIAYFLLESGRELSPLSSCRMAADLKIVSRLIGEDLPLIDRYSNILSLMTPGYVRDDLLDLCKLAVFPQLQLPQPSGIVDNAIAASTEAMGRISLSSVMTQHEPTPSTSLDLTCFRKAIDLLRPSDPLLTEFCTLERIDEAVGGYGEQLSELKQMILWHSTYQDTFKRMGASQSRGALLYGPSGCGKSLITRHLSGSYLYHVLFLKGPELFSKYIGETERAVRKIFQTARRIAPCVLVLDDLEYIGAKRDPTLSDGHGGDEQQILQDRVLSTLLNEMDGVDTLTMNAVGSDQVFVLGCCSDPAIIDEALIRAGRLGKRIYIPPPSAKDRQEIIDLCLRKHCSPEQCQLFEAQSLLKQVMVELTEGQTGADIDLLIRIIRYRMKKEADKSKGLPPLQLDKHFIEKCWRDQFDKRN